jgi:hypothetical protein
MADQDTKTQIHMDELSEIVTGAGRRLSRTMDTMFRRSMKQSRLNRALNAVEKQIKTAVESGCQCIRWRCNSGLGIHSSGPGKCDTLSTKEKLTIAQQINKSTKLKDWQRYPDDLSGLRCNM